MRRAVVLLREQPCYRREAFAAGLAACGYSVSMVHQAPQSVDDVLVIWNRYGFYHQAALAWEKAGARVLVAENGYLGREWNGAIWYALARNYHNGAGSWPHGPQRVDIPVEPWRDSGSFVLVLAQRGIGPDGVRQPDRRVENAVKWLRSNTTREIRVRQHPGENTPAHSLGEDLRNAWCAVTWGSGAALKALCAGIPVFYGLRSWIGGAAAAPFQSDIEQPPLRDRRPMLARLSWAMWRLDEIECGRPFQGLLHG